MKIMEIRTYREEDAERIFEIFNETTQKYNWDEFSEEQKKVALFEDVKYVHDALGSNIALVLEDEGEIRGFVVLTRDGYIRFFYVDIRHLGKGYGRKLMLAIEEKAREIGLKKL